MPHYTPTKNGYIVACHICQNTFLVKGVTAEQIRAWEGGTVIQLAMAQVPEDERELFISGTCGECWEKLFADEEDGEMDSGKAGIVQPAEALVAVQRVETLEALLERTIPFVMYSSVRHVSDLAGNEDDKHAVLAAIQLALSEWSPEWSPE